MLVKSVGDKKIRKKREGEDGVFWKVKAPGRHPGQLRPASLELCVIGGQGVPCESRMAVEGHRYLLLYFFI